MVTRAIGGYPEATRSLVTGIDVGGINVVVSDPAGDHPPPVEFQVPIEVPDHLTPALIELLHRARAARGEARPTPPTPQAARPASLPTPPTELCRGAHVT